MKKHTSASMKLETDIGMDELSENCYRIAVSDIETGKVVAHVFGTTPDEAQSRADTICNAVNNEG